jgi:hypothetical protein
MEQFLYSNAGSVVIGIVLLLLYGKIKTQILADAKTAAGTPDKREITPTPLPISMHREPFDAERFERAETERKQDRTEIKDTLKQIQKDLLESNRYQATARQKIHGRLNRHENAIYYMAGKEEAAGNTHAARVIRERLESRAGGADE